MFKTAIFFIALLFVSLTSFAGTGRCPQSANSLQDFGGCLAYTPNGQGMRYVGTSAELDDDHVQLLNAMQANPRVPPQVMPVAQMAYPLSASIVYAAGGTNPYAWIQYQYSSPSMYNPYFNPYYRPY